MRMAKGWMRAGFAAALFALLLAPALAGAGSALAQDPLPASYYGGVGGDLAAGDTVTAMIGDASCGSDEAEADGGWAIYVNAGDCGGAAEEGATVNFMIGDAMAEQSVEWTAGYTPDDIASGITLTLAAMPEPEDGMDGDGDGSMMNGDGDDSSMTDGDGSMDGGMTPAAPDTGNAGLATASGGGAASWLALGFGLLALAATAGGRFATGRVR